MMKVLFITHATDLSGANSSMLQLIIELRDNHAIRPFVICPHIYESKDNNIQTECRKNGIPCISHRMTTFKRKKTSFIQKIYFIVFQSIYILHLLWILRNMSFDLIHTNASVLDTGAYLSFFKKTPHVWHLREFGKKDFNLVSCLGIKYEKWIYKKCSKFIAISKCVKTEFSSVIPLNMIELIYNGIPYRCEQIKSEHQSSITQFCIVGRVEPNKNQLEALLACKILKDRGISNFKLTIIGRCDKKYYQTLIDYIQYNQLDNIVEILGQRYDVNNLLSKMDVGLTLSTCEAFGRVTIEYMMQNLAVIATDTGANPELIENDVNGMLYPLGNANELANKMAILINDKGIIEDLGMKGMHYSISKFNSISNSDSIYSLYYSILKHE